MTTTPSMAVFITSILVEIRATRFFYLFDHLEQVLAILILDHRLCQFAHAFFDHLSRNDREKTNLPTTSINEDFAELKDIPATMHNPEEDIINQQEYDKWLNNIEKLKDDYRVVAKMNLIDNFGYKEIAEALDMPLNTVKTKIRRAKNQLLKMMEYSDELL